jgi:tagaturonate reductase
MPVLGEAVWRAAGVYDRAALAESVLMFGTGGLLRALVAAAVDSANRSGRSAGAIVAVQSTPDGWARTLNRQDGLFTLVERGGANGDRIETTRVVGAITRALVAADEWSRVRDVAANPALRVIVSNVTEAGFHGGAGSYAARLTDLLHTRFERAPDADPIIIIPTELVPDNGARLGAMVDAIAAEQYDDARFRDWLTSHVRIAESLVDRITTGIPVQDDAASLAARLGYTDALMTVTEPDALWAIEGDPDRLRAAIPIDGGNGVVFAPDIEFHRRRKIRLLNGAHTAMAPLALLAGVTTVREATAREPVARFFRHLLFDELVTGSGLDYDVAESYARNVWGRFSNPWLEHSWATITANQSEKVRIRVVPSIIDYAARCGHAPRALALALAAHLRFVRADADALDDEVIWGWRLSDIPGLAHATSHWLSVLESEGSVAAIDAFFATNHT